MTATHDCGRSIASIVREIDDLRAENTKLLAVVDRYRQERDEAREENTRIQARQIAEVAERIDSRSNAMVVELTESIARVRARHTDADDGCGMCHECGWRLPCPTLRDLDGPT